MVETPSVALLHHGCLPRHRLPHHPPAVAPHCCSPAASRAQGVSCILQRLSRRLCLGARLPLRHHCVLRGERANYDGHQALQEAVAQQDLLFGFAFAACGLLLAALFASLRKAVRRMESRVEELEQEMRLLRAGMTKVFVGAESSAGT